MTPRRKETHAHGSERANAETFADRLTKQRTVPNHRSFGSPTHPPKVLAKAPAEGGRAPPNVADPARCTESSTARGCIPALRAHSRRIVPSRRTVRGWYADALAASSSERDGGGGGITFLVLIRRLLERTASAIASESSSSSVNWKSYIITLRYCIQELGQVPSDVYDRSTLD